MYERQEGDKFRCGFCLTPSEWLTSWYRATEQRHEWRCATCGIQSAVFPMSAPMGRGDGVVWIGSKLDPTLKRPRVLKIGLPNAPGWPQAELSEAPGLSFGHLIGKFCIRWERLPVSAVAFWGTDRIRRLYLTPPGAPEGNSDKLCHVECDDTGTAMDLIRMLAHGWGLSNMLKCDPTTKESEP